MPMGLLGSTVGWPVSRCDGIRGCVHWGLEPLTSHQPFAKPRSIRGGLVLAWLGRRCCNLLPYLCAAADPPFP